MVKQPEKQTPRRRKWQLGWKKKREPYLYEYCHYFSPPLHGNQVNIFKRCSFLKLQDWFWEVSEI